MLRVLLIRTGSTPFDEQGRIKGSLDLPLSDSGCREARKIADDLQYQKIKTIYAAPCLAAKQTALCMAEKINARIKWNRKLQNIDRGLWQGMLIEDLRRSNPRVYRQWQEVPDSVCPPQGETLAEARERLQECLDKITRKHREDETIAVVAAEPVASLICEILTGVVQTELWQVECKSGNWECIDVKSRQLAT
jgi:broad specificity phosphatase PhoE